MVVGGHGKEADEEAGIEDVAPPVAQGAYVPLKGVGVSPRAAHFPDAVRGSLGIHPSRRPSWYDQDGEPIAPAALGPIYRQKMSGKIPKCTTD